ncbi:hypothetical protein B0H17DRAFT_1207810 [Mycena rosella]|uniref:Uncharacterized protein n=1 Tax=Mycena rosella TaxID=1033263 RepID=A0AAD7D264_MYCRO|nr:hypothetical protein B0H17DRAFT_1207810 [Mycena rosella]
MTHLDPAAPGAESSTSAPAAATSSPASAGASPATALEPLSAALASFQRATDPAGASVAAPAAAPVAPIAPVAARSCGASVRFQLLRPLDRRPSLRRRPTGPLLPVAVAPTPTEDAPLWYAITRGHYVGVTLSNALALGAVSGVSSSSMKSYRSQMLAVAAFNEMLQYCMVVVIP